jgi:hypothetical protein
MAYFLAWFCLCASGATGHLVTTIPARGAKEVNVGEGVHMLPRYGVSPELVRRVRSDKELQRLKRDPRSAGSNNVWSVNNALTWSVNTALTRSFCTRSNVRLSRSADAQSHDSTKRVHCARKLWTHAAWCSLAREVATHGASTLQGRGASLRKGIAPLELARISHQWEDENWAGPTSYS